MKNTTHTTRTTHTTHTSRATRTPHTSRARAATAPDANITTPDEKFFADEIIIANEARRQALEVITRVLIWIVEGANAPSRETRATIAIYCVRPDLIGSPTLEQIGHAAGISGQAAHKLARDFRVSMGL